MQVTIRPLQEHDAHISVKWRNDPEVFKYTGNTYKTIISIENELEWIRNVIVKNQVGRDFRCAIEVDGIYVGNIYLTGIENGAAEYHIFIGDKNYWGKGVAKQASVLILKYAFETLRLNTVYLEVNKRNIVAFLLYQSLGFLVVSEKSDSYSMEVKGNRWATISTTIHVGAPQDEPESVIVQL